MRFAAKRVPVGPVLLQQRREEKVAEGHLRTHALQQIAIYSITSSAVASNLSGTVTPRSTSVGQSLAQPIEDARERQSTRADLAVHARTLRVGESH
jgi:hypothetical protein